MSQQPPPQLHWQYQYHHGLLHSRTLSTSNPCQLQRFQRRRSLQPTGFLVEQDSISFITKYGSPQYCQYYYSPHTQVFHPATLLPISYPHVRSQCRSLSSLTPSGHYQASSLIPKLPIGANTYYSTTSIINRKNQTVGSEVSSFSMTEHSIQASKNAANHQETEALKILQTSHSVSSLKSCKYYLQEDSHTKTTAVPDELKSSIDTYQETTQLYDIRSQVSTPIIDQQKEKLVIKTNNFPKTRCIVSPSKQKHSRFTVYWKCCRCCKENKQEKCGLFLEPYGKIESCKCGHFVCCWCRKPTLSGISLPNLIRSLS